jgi:hypothetical protein
MPVLNRATDDHGGSRKPSPVSGERGMGIIVQFPDGHRPLSGGRYVDANSEPASVIILPVVRIERNPDQPSDGLDSGTGATPGRRRRRRSRS